MARRKRNGKRAVGIQSKKGHLYLVFSHTVLKDGQKTTKNEWIATGLTDSPDNVKKAEEMRLRLKQRAGSDKLDRNITISDYTDCYLEKKHREVADTTFAKYYYEGKRIKDNLGTIKVKELSKQFIEEFLDSLFTNKQLQFRTVKDTKVTLTCILDMAVSDGLIAYNPAKDVVINRNLAAQYAQEKNNDEEFLSYAEAQLFLVKAKDHELFEFFYIMLFFGLRREEALGLRWSAINFSKKTLTIDHTVTVGTRVNRQNSTKTSASRRTYPLTDEQISLFERVMENQKQNQLLFGDRYVKTDYIFTHADGTLYYPDYPTKVFKKIIKRTPQLPQNVTLEKLRNSCVSILVHEGLDIKSIQKWVGHSDPTTTLKIYTKVKDADAKEQVSATMMQIIPLNNNGGVKQE